MLYAHAYYEEDEFWSIYDNQWYNDIRKKYGAESTLSNVYDTVKVKGVHNTTTFKGFWKLLWKFITMKA